MKSKIVRSISDGCFHTRPLQYEVDEFLYNNIFTNPDINKKERNMRIFDCGNGFKYLYPGITHSYPDMFNTKLMSICRKHIEKFSLHERIEERWRHYSE